MSRFILDTLRDAPEPLSTEQITDRLIAKRGMGDLGLRHARMIEKRVTNTLRHKTKQGLVRGEQRPGRITLWEAVK